MAKKFKNKYRIETARAKWWDYSSDGFYFITIVTKNRNAFFGKIVNGEMVLNDIGIITQKYWNEIPKHFSFVILDEMIIMPNHIHGIIGIKNLSNVKTLDNVVDDKTFDDAMDDKDVACNVSKTPQKTSQNHNKNQIMSNISPKHGSLASVVRSFKSVVTKNACKLNSEFGWQSRFHDRIVRDQGELNRIRKYIKDNPRKWDDDQLL